MTDRDTITRAVIGAVVALAAGLTGGAAMAPPDLTATAQRVTGDHADRIEALQAIVVGCCVAPRHPGGPAQPVPPQPPAEPDAGGGESDDGEGQAPTVEPSPAPPVLPPAPFPEGPVERWPE